MKDNCINTEKKKLMAGKLQDFNSCWEERKKVMTFRWSDTGWTSSPMARRKLYKKEEANVLRKAC